MSHLRPYLHPTYVDLPVLSHFKMSTAPTVTASVAHDQTLGFEHDIVNHICFLAATQENGTLLQTDSFQEEDIVKFCIGLGQVHLEGVLWLLDTKMVLMLCSRCKM